jgi:heat shock protein HtpX
LALAGGDAILLRSARARLISKHDAPRLWNVTEEMTIASGLAGMPRIYIIDDPEPNAFAVGRKPEAAAVAVTTGLLKRLNRDELQGVVAHEIAHVRNLDVRFMTIAAVMVGSIVLISDLFFRSLWHGGFGGRRSSSRGGGQAQLIILVVVIALAILAPIFARLLYFACSRRREYLADASAARFTRFPNGLASALEKISRKAGSSKKVNRALAPMYIVNPLQARSLTGWFSTHPPTTERIKILRSMGGRAGYVDYEAAFKKVTGTATSGLSQQTLDAEESISARTPTAEPETKDDAVARAREAIEIVDRMIGLIPVLCICGVRIKIPEGFKKPSLNCPRCGREHPVPKAESDASAASETAASPPIFRRKTTGWESFQCPCGRTIQLSPSFKASQIRCSKCRRAIRVQSHQ